MSKSFISKSFYIHPKSLHALPKFASKKQRIQVGNGQFVSVLFIIPVIIDVHGHRFEIYTSVSMIHENVDLVLGIKNVFKLEGVINSQDCCFKFLNISFSNYQNFRSKFLQYHADKIKIYMQHSNVSYSKQWHRNCNF